MDIRWTLKVRNFANISEAEVEIAPILCFVGDNNSGKSYMMSLLWGILTVGKDIFPSKPSDSKSYKACEEWLCSNIENTAVIDERAQRLYLAWYNDLLAANKSVLLKKIFNYSVEIGSLEIKDLRRKSALSIEWNNDGSRYSLTRSHIKFPAKGAGSECTRAELLRMNCYICWNLLMQGIAAPLYTPIIKGRRMGEPVYLPASRTGFMLTFSSLTEASIKDKFALSEDGTDISNLTLPYIDFLQLITKFNTTDAPQSSLKPIAQFVELNMTKGAVVARKEYLPVITYMPQALKKELPLHVSSSVVTEIAPILLLLKSNIKFKSIIIEEPEAHLHPALQTQMARLLIKLANAGYPVWITTHSDTIIQHVNNMIKLSEQKEGRQKELLDEFGYAKDDIIIPQNIQMFQFDHDAKEKTVISRLTSNKFGFVVPTFNDALDRIVKEIYAFQKEDD
ncbi:MAG: AAA family ATPase [Cloacibacillus sp.]